MVTVDQLKSLLNLQPHPVEGGCFAETYRCGEAIPVEALPSRYDGARSLATLSL